MTERFRAAQKSSGSWLSSGLDRARANLARAKMTRANLARANLARLLNEPSLSWGRLGSWLDSARIKNNFYNFFFAEL
jgi:uncharacterized protein YjbI with pentapeptide repeats